MKILFKEESKEDTHFFFLYIIKNFWTREDLLKLTTLQRWTLKLDFLDDKINIVACHYIFPRIFFHFHPRALISILISFTFI